MKRHGYEVERIIAENIVIGTRHRTVSADRVAALAESIKQIGLKTPITVRIVDGAPVLVAGATRLAAVMKLGVEDIDCIVIDGGEVEAELWELSENLHRVDLTKEERDKHIRRYAELLKAREEAESARKVFQNETVSKPKTGRGNKGIATKIAEETGLSKATVHRALNPPPPKPQPPARNPLNDIETTERQVDRLMAAWNAAGKEARETFLARIERPVFDQTRAA